MLALIRLVTLNIFHDLVSRSSLASSRSYVLCSYLMWFWSSLRVEFTMCRSFVWVGDLVLSFASTLSTLWVSILGDPQRFQIGEFV